MVKITLTFIIASLLFSCGKKGNLPDSKLLDELNQPAQIEKERIYKF